MVFVSFWSENGYTPCPFGLESSIVFEGTKGVRERIYFFQFQMSKKEREICEFEMDLKYSFLFAL